MSVKERMADMGISQVDMILELQKRGNTEQTTLRLPEELFNQLQQEACRIGVSFNAYVLMLIDKARRGQQG